MSIKNTGKRKIRPTHPGEMLREDFLPDYKLNITCLAQAIGEKEGKSMKTKTKYTEEPMGHLRVVKDFLPPPENFQSL